MAAYTSPKSFQESLALFIASTSFVVRTRSVLPSIGGPLDEYFTGLSFILCTNFSNKFQAELSRKRFMSLNNSEGLSTEGI